MEATDEEVAQAKQSLEAGHPLPIGLQAKLLARLERVEGELAQTEKECENALAALAGEPYPYPEVRRKK